MMDDLLASFLPRFTELARTRLARSLEIVTTRDHEGTADVARDLHAVAGEAGILGLSSIVPLARASEAHAKRLRASRADEDAAALAASLTELQHAIELVAAPAHKNP